MAGISAYAYLPDGQLVGFPIPPYPRTWVDQAAGVKGDGLRAPLVEYDAGGGVLWHRQRALFQGFQSLAQSIPTATFTAITGLTELIDNYSGHSDTTNTGRYYVPNTGNGGSNDWYLCSGFIPFSSTDATTPFMAGFRVTGSATVNECGKMPSGAGHNVDVMALDLVRMSTGTSDYIELVGRQITGGAVNTVVASRTPSLTVRWVATDTSGAGVATPALPSPHVWVATDRATASATGTVSGHTLVPLNRELRDVVAFLNNPPIARLTAQTSVQTIPTGAGTWTSIAFPTETVDSYNGHDNVTNNTRYTCQRAGLYLIAGLASVAEAGTNIGYRAVRLQQTFAAGGTTTFAGWTTLPHTTSTSGTAIYATALVRMAVGDYIETQMSHTQGAALTVASAAGPCARMIAVWMAA